MTMWKPDLTRYGGHPAEALAEAIADAIASGALPPGTRMPTHRDLAYDLGLAVATVSKAYSIVARRNLVSGEVGRGTFVNSGPRLPTLADQDAETSGTVDLRICMPPSVGQDVVLAAAIEDVVRNGGARAMLRYPLPGGTPVQRAAGVTWMERVYPDTNAGEVLVTAGAHQGIATALATAVGPGGTLLCDPLTYAGVAQIANVMGIHLRAVPMDSEGMIAEALDEAIGRYGARAVFLIPTCHNPMTLTMSAARCEQIAAVAQKRDIVIIEDHIYADLQEAPLKAMATYAPERCILVTSLSKTISVALRVGFMRLPQPLVAQAENHLQSLVLANSPLLAEVATNLISSGRADDLRHKVGAELEARFRIARSALGNVAFIGGPHCPHLWVPLSDAETMNQAASALARQGYWVAVARDFAIARENVPAGLRIALGPTAHRHKVAELCQALRQFLAAPAAALSGVV